MASGFPKPLVPPKITSNFFTKSRQCARPLNVSAFKFDFRIDKVKLLSSDEDKSFSQAPEYDLFASS